MTALTPKVDLKTTDAQVDAEVERLCALGCREVYTVIDRLDAGGSVEGLNGLDRTQRAQVLEELRSIMAVYAENGSACLLSEA